MSDLLLPIVIIITMIILVDYFDKWPGLLLTGFLFLPIAWIFTYQLRDGLYSELFGADMSGYLLDLPGLELILSLVMWFVPMLIFMKLLFIRMEDSSSGDEGDF